jgi:DsbC/DsbD-like thiol-disulfide interchange protein
VIASIVVAAALASETPLVTASLVRAKVDGVTWVGVHYRIAEGWHIYWENPGQSGLPTTATITGVDARGPIFPGPEKFVLPGGIVNNGYEHDATLLFRVRDGEKVHASTRWLVCRQECIPGSAELEATLDEFPRKERRIVTRALSMVPIPVDVRSFPLAADRITHAEVFPSLSFESAGGLATAGVAGDRIVLTLAPLDALSAGPIVVRLAGPDELRYVQVFSTDGDPE